MGGKNRDDVARYAALHWGLYRAQVALGNVEEELTQQSACPKGHPFAGGFETDDEGRVTGIKPNVRIEPDGRVKCKLCGAQRIREWRQSLKRSPAEIIEAAEADTRSPAECVTTKEDVLAEEGPDAR